MAETTAKPVPGTPTQVAHPGKATLRTVVQTAIPAILGFVVIAPQVIEAVLSEPSIPDNLRVWLAGIAAGIIAVAGIIARVMAIPGVENFLIKLGLDTGVSKEPAPAPPEALEDPVTSFDGAAAAVPDEDGRHRGDYLGG